MKKFKRYNIKELLKNPVIKRDWICKGTVACMAREGVDVSLEQVYDMYDKFTINKIRMPDGYHDCLAAPIPPLVALFNST